MHANLFQALADPARRRIVESLRSGERAVSDLIGVAGVHQSGVSRHLRVLSKAGFVKVRPDGPKRLYSLRAEPFRELDTWLDRYRTLWEGRLDALAEALDQKQRAREAARREAKP